MKQIQAIALSFALMLLTVVPSSVQAARKQKAPEPEPVTQEMVVADFQQYLQENNPFLCDVSQQRRIEEIKQFVDVLKGRSDSEKASYIEEKGVTKVIEDTRQELSRIDEQKIKDIVTTFLNKYDGRGLSTQDIIGYSEQLTEQLSSNVQELNKNLTRLDNEINTKENKPLIDWENLPWLWIGIGLCALVLLIILFVVIGQNKKKSQRNYRPAAPRVSNYGGHPASGGQQQSADGGIVVRRKTATILKKQSLEDVIDNPNYLQVDAIDFTYESAVRRIYIKNSCIIDIYNMYAEDLRNPDSPKEDGCMVLGRWVHDAENNEYYVSLEEIVLPGDDAVFEEYALNFGGKIKLKVLEQLRKLRRETNLQYDLTCWVHSHPGLGVFFSNSDTSVQDQLKHPQHPNFLTAIVVDILTPMQDLGIFTYRRDTTINSKQDLKKMYSLIDWYHWAQESLKTSVERPVAAMPKEFKSVEYFNMLQNAHEHNDACYGVELSKNVVVDICTDLVGQGDDILAMLHGLASQHGSQIEYVAEQISDKESEPKLSLTGCFIAAPHCSIPTVRRAVADYLDRIRFVVVYTPSDGLLTTIPIINSDLCTEESYYGEQKLEDLKTWIKQGR